ncbi:MAG: hypothetical protein PHC97_01635 [Patescibacteria group bacterium]|nr:hypothetical protein [Patescibacteria group bacterium]
MNKKFLIASLLVLVLILSGCGITSLTRVLSADEAKAKAVDFINKNLVAAGTTVTIDKVTEESGLYKLTVTVNGQSVDSYMTKDGTKFFTQAIDIAQVEKDNAQNSGQDTNTAKEIPKNDKPVVELFVMSQCPYGTQIEKGIIPVVQALGSKIDFQIKFVDYAMHGDVEIKEEMNQVCIEKDFSKDYLTYLQCFLKAGDGASCLKEAKIDTAKLSTCVSALDKQYSITANAADKTKWSNGTYPPFDVNKADNVKYGVQGSPTLIINGVESQSARDSASLLSAICSGFNTAPSGCSTKLSSDTPAAGFGTGTSDTASSASCGN